jgi:hypothetical protein
VRPFNVALEVKYKNPETAFDVIAATESDPTEIAANITFRKSEEWEFEKEYRIASNLGDIRQIPFHPSAIKEIRLGACINAKDYFFASRRLCGLNFDTSSGPHFRAISQQV